MDAIFNKRRASGIFSFVNIEIIFPGKEYTKADIKKINIIEFLKNFLCWILSEKGKVAWINCEIKTFISPIIFTATVYIPTDFNPRFVPIIIWGNLSYIVLEVTKKKEWKPSVTRIFISFNFGKYSVSFSFLYIQKFVMRARAVSVNAYAKGYIHPSAFVFIALKIMMAKKSLLKKSVANKYGILFSPW